jgi:hypothetical protein
MRVVSAIGIISIVLLASHSTQAGQTAVRQSAFSAKQAETGRMEIQQNSFGACTSCHTSTLTGRSGNPDELPPLNTLKKDDQELILRYGGRVPALAGQAFRTRWATRSTKDLTEEFLGRFGQVSEETRLNIIAYILQQNGAVSGTQPLTMSTDVEIRTLFPGQ